MSGVANSQGNASMGGMQTWPTHRRHPTLTEPPPARQFKQPENPPIFLSADTAFPGRIHVEAPPFRRFQPPQFP
jgi:hypothetical protein